jgi:Gpi18-like mannosyltransferase
MAVSQAAVLVLAAAAAAAAAASLFPRAGPLAAILPFAAPGFALSIVGGYAEPLAVAFGLWAIVFALKERIVASSVMLALAVLTKENALVIVAGLLLWMVARRRWRSAALLTGSLVPVIGWYAFVAGRFGHIPVLDPYLARAAEFPGVGLFHSLTDATSTGSAVAAAIHVGLVVVVVLLARRSIYGLIASIAGLQVLFASPFAWKWIGDATRISVFIQLFAVLALFAWWRSDSPVEPRADQTAHAKHVLIPVDA